MSKKKSFIWHNFTVSEDTKFAKCKTCGQAVSRGGTTGRTFNTSNLVNHLKKNHIDEYKKYVESVEAAKAKDSSTDKQAKHQFRQLTMGETVDKGAKWDINDPRAQRIHTKIGEMIALDFQPFSIVEDAGFSRLLGSVESRYNIPSRRYITETVMPKIHDRTKNAVFQEITDVPNISFTTDIWSTDVNMHSLLSLTAHWITESFERKSAILHVQPFDGSHTGENIAAMFEEMFRSWKINKDRVHLVVRDNASNMVKAMTDASLPHLGCFAHTLQLVVHDGVLTQRAVVDMLATSRRIVSHFRRSCLAYDSLRNIQANLGLPQHRLVQDEPTRWNSTLHMLQRVLEQKMALGAYATEHQIPQLTQNQLNLADKVVKVLAPIDEVTKSISEDVAAVSVIIPFVRILLKTLSQNEDESDSGVRTMKEEMKSSLTRRYADVEKNEKLTIATILDPRFKNKFFCGQSVKDNVHASVQQLMEDLNGAVQPSHPVQNTSEPPPKRTCIVWTTYSELLEEAGAHVSCDGESGSNELDIYLGEQVVQLGRESPDTWWSKNIKRFPNLAKIAQKYLSAPPSSVASERLFSGAGIVYGDKRNRLAPEKAEMLLFIKNNFKMYNQGCLT